MVVDPQPRIAVRSNKDKLGVKLSTVIFANNYRGFREIEIDVSQTTFLVGDNSSGKSSVLHLINYVMRSRLYGPPSLDDNMGVGPYDFFSPYFNYAPVTIGFHTAYPDGSKTTRIIEIHRSKSGTPSVKRALYSFNGVYVLMKETAQSIMCKTDSQDLVFSIDDLRSIFESEKGFKKIDRKDLPEADLNSPINAYISATKISSKLGKGKEIHHAVFTLNHQNPRHCAPLRAQAERYYTFERKYKASGTHFASMWHDLKADHSSDLNKSIQKFGRASGLFDDVDVRPISGKIQDSPLTVLVTRNNKSFALNQVGVGVSQVVPILVECIFGSFEDPKPLMLLQQPELHLHPIAQAAVGDFLFEMRLGGLVSIIETHSDFLIDRYRARINESETEHNAVILYCYSNSDGNHYNLIQVSQDGTLLNPPENYNEFFVNEIMRTMF